MSKELKPKALICIDPESNVLTVKDIFSVEDICRAFHVKPKLVEVIIYPEDKALNTKCPQLTAVINKTASAIAPVVRGNANGL